MMHQIKRMESILNYIKQILVNREIDCEEDWENTPEALTELDALARTDQNQVSTSVKMTLDGKEKLVFAVFSSSPDGLLKQVQAQIPALVQTSDTSVLHLVFFVRNMRDRVLLEQTFIQTYKLPVLTTARKEAKNTRLILRCTYVLDPSCEAQNVKLKNIRRHEIIQMPPLSGNINLEPTAEPEKEAAVSLPRAIVLTIDLFQLAELYNLIGDRLFKNNVRFGISETLGVDQSIRQTLEEEPEYFWFKNNGITILVDNPGFQLKHAESLLLGTIGTDKLPDFSVINGAQTISTSAKFFFELEQDKSKKDVLARAKTAQVMLRIIYTPKAATPEQQDISQQKSKEISISLNRQKPIKMEDIAFTTPFSKKLVDYLAEKHETDKELFQLVRRGEGAGLYRALDLVQFSRARMACAGEPGEARSQGTNELLKVRQEESGAFFANKTVFVDGWMEADGTAAEEFFRRHYGAVWFAHRTALEYEAQRRKMKEADMDVLTVIGNGKWYFAAILTQMFNRFSMSPMPDGKELPDFSHFEGTFAAIQEKIPEAMVLFAEAVVLQAKAAGTAEKIDSNLFKSNVLYRDLIQALIQVLKDQDNSEKGAGAVSNIKLQKFAELFFPSGLKPLGKPAAAGNTAPSASAVSQPSMPAASRPSVPAVSRTPAKNAGYILLKKQSVPVDSVAQAMQETVQYILTHYSVDDASLKTASSNWLTEDLTVAEARLGYFRTSLKSLTVGQKTYWLGTASDTTTKVRQITSLCQLAHVPKNEIFWYAASPDTPEFTW